MNMAVHGKYMLFLVKKQDLLFPGPWSQKETAKPLSDSGSLGLYVLYRLPHQYPE
jgi:hypothetical protein